jgi:hypothetical protein
MIISAAYAAGLFDGEGCVTFYQSRGYTNPILVIAISDRWALESLATRWGGRVHNLASQQKPGRLPIYHWRLFGKTALDFALDIRPHLLIKRAEIDIVLPYLGCYGRQPEKHAARAALRALRADRPRTVSA